MRVIIYTGKGGVGKTSAAAATARMAARMGYRTMVMSTDAAHSLSDSLETNLSGHIQTVDENLDAIEIDVIEEMETRWKEIEMYVTDLLRAQGQESLSAKELAVLPGMELMSALFYLWDFEQNERYDVVIMDTAPTAETLRLLSFPDVSRWYIDKLYTLVRRMMSMARNTVGRMVDVPMPTDGFLTSMQNISERMISVRTLIQDPDRTTIRLVVNPERMVINETKRAYTYMCLYGMTVECLVLNRLIPEEECSGYFKTKIEEQERYVKMIHEAFDPMTILNSYQMPTELVGPERLDDLADMLFDGDDPTQIYSRESPMKFWAEEGANVMSLVLPFSEKGEVELYNKEGDSLIVQVGNHRRNITLPLSLARADMLGAELKDGRLQIRFEKGDTDV